MPRSFLLVLCILFPILVLAQGAAKPPAVLFSGTYQGTCCYQVAQKLANAGLALNVQGWPGLHDAPLSWDTAKRYNVIVLTGLGLANADMTLPDRVNTTRTTLQQYLAAGGGVLLFSAYGQMATEGPAQTAFLQPLGLIPLFNEMPLDPDSSVKATSWKLNFAYTNAFTPSPVTNGLKNLWYPAPTGRPGAQNHLTTFTVDNSWTVLVRGGHGSFTRTGSPTDPTPTEAGTYSHDVPLLAVKQVGKGRLMYLGITPEYLTGPVAMTTLEGITLERGLKGIPSDGYKLLENALKWLAEPSVAEGTLGGATMDAHLLDNPNKTKFGQPFTWPNEPVFPAECPAYSGVIGARTRYSSGSATPDEWVAKAKTKGLSFLVFLEEFRKLTPEKFAQLKADCTRLSTPDFAVVPGFTIDDEVGNHYFYCGPNMAYPEKRHLSADGTVFVSWPGLSAKTPYEKGQIAGMLLDYTYTFGSFKLTGGNYLFSKDAAPFADFFSDWDATGVITAQGGKVIEDATGDYLKLVASGQGPLPLALDLLDSPAQLDQSTWRTVLRLPAQGTGSLIAGPLNQATKLRDYFSIWHGYPENPAVPYITSGPEIAYWGYTGSRDYDGNNKGEFVWQNQRWVLRGVVKSAVGVKEVDVYDGTTLFRRYLPGGKTEFTFTLDLTHDRQHNLSLIVTDLRGGRAVGGEQIDRNHRSEEFMCGDRNNQLSYGYSTRSDGTGVLIGGNQSIGTPLKRIDSGISPSGTFKNDALLGAPAFDGGAGGEPNFFDITTPVAPALPVTNPDVNEAHRLLMTGDVNIGDGVRAHHFMDNIGVHNVWGTLWRTEPAKDFRVARRNHFFQIDPDSPLAVFLWQIDITLLDDLPNKGFNVGLLAGSDDRLWAVRSSDGRVCCGTWEDSQRSTPRYLNTPFNKGAYSALLDSPLGGAAVYSLTDGMISSVGLPTRGRFVFQLTPEAAPQKKGETKRVEFLIVGIPRVTDYTKNLAGASTETVERFYRDFGMDGGKTGYTLQLTAGKVIDQRYLLRVDGTGGGFSGTVTGNLISTLPIVVSGMNDHWSSYLYDRGKKAARSLGNLDGNAWAVVPVHGAADLFIGQPVTADKANVVIQVTQTGNNTWRMEAHNPTDAPITTTLKANSLFDPLKGSAWTQEQLTIPAGSSVWRDL
ncbi:MAG TPA: hypothetical protein VGM23_04325 [Armatimonadota bacterium]|jgi:hypothetical protein